MSNFYDKTSLYEKLNNLDCEEKILLKHISYFYCDREKRNRYFDRLVDVRCWKKEIRDKIYFMDELEKRLNK